ncbi:MAG TPA: hypothetical protein EYH06_09285 [Chromatiales bacterium]|nr:hypothetical protein [Thiotrichales bacterium]HIP68769.1 hypothetical protein [Chromatiales bacterium]
MWRLIFLLTTLLLASCATGPGFSVPEANRDIQPGQVSTQPELANQARVVWGGVIASSKNLSDETRLEIIAYPLARSSQRPKTEGATNGRFIIVQKGYLEPLDYAKGRKITVKGVVQGTEMGQIGEAKYRYAILSPEEIYLWPVQSERQGIPIRFGIGFVFHN